MYQIIEAHYPAFLAELTARDRTLPAYVQREVENYLTCGLLKHGFLRGRYSDCHAERLVAFSCKRRGFCPSCDVLDEVHCQVSIIQTDADRVVDPESARFAYRKLASHDKELHWIASARHGILSEDIGATHDLVLDFLARCALKAQD